MGIFLTNSLISSRTTVRHEFRRHPPPHIETYNDFYTVQICVNYKSAKIYVDIEKFHFWSFFFVLETTEKQNNGNGSQCIAFGIKIGVWNTKLNFDKFIRIEIKHILEGERNFGKPLKGFIALYFSLKAMFRLINYKFIFLKAQNIMDFVISNFKIFFLKTYWILHYCFTCRRSNKM